MIEGELLDRFSEPGNRIMMRAERTESIALWPDYADIFVVAEVAEEPLQVWIIRKPLDAQDSCRPSVEPLVVGHAVTGKLADGHNHLPPLARGVGRETFCLDNHIGVSTIWREAETKVGLEGGTGIGSAVTGQIAIDHKGGLPEDDMDPVVDREEKLVVAVRGRDALRDIDFNGCDGRPRGDLDVARYQAQGFGVLDDFLGSDGRNRRAINRLNRCGGRWRRLREPAVCCCLTRRSIDIQVINLKAQPINDEGRLEGDREFPLARVRRGPAEVGRPSVRLRASKHLIAAGDQL